MSAQMEDLDKIESNNTGSFTNCFKPQIYTNFKAAKKITEKIDCSRWALSVEHVLRHEWGARLWNSNVRLIQLI
jgi:hypothetical protein